MAVTGAIFKALTFNGESSRNYGVYITGQAVYNAPNRDVEMITIPGRSGSFPLDHGRYENIEVTYPAGVFADNEDDFAELISDFRNMLCSANGYCRLEDEYNPNEYRLAIYKSGLEVEPTALKAGEFDITFECKPQRYLKSGEEPVTMGDWTDVETHTGNPIILDAGDPAKEVKNLDVELTPIQDLNGYDKPWSGGAGKNKWITQAYAGLGYNMAVGTVITLSERTVTFNGNKIDYAVTAWGARGFISTPLTAGSWHAHLELSTPASGYRISVYVVDSSNKIKSCDNYTDVTSVNPTKTVADGDFIGVAVSSNVDRDIEITNYQIESGNAYTSWTPYSNICPITGHDSVTVTDTGKNLFDPQKAVQDSASSQVTIDGDWITFKTDGSRLVYNYTVDGAVTLSAIVKSDVATSNAIRFYAYYSDGTNAMFAGVTTTDTNEHYLTGTTNANKTLVKIQTAWTDSKAATAKEIQLEYGSTASAYEPFTKTTKTVTLPHTVYGAGVGVTSGTGTETLANIASYNGETINEPWWSSMDEYVQGTTPTTGAQVVYTLATPLDLTTTPTDLTLYNGDNVVSSDGDMTLEIGKKITGVDNPTRFEASPELQIKGYGTVAFNGYQIVIDDQPYGNVELIDSAYKSYGSTLTLGSDDYAINADTITVSANMPFAFGTRSDSYEIRSASLYTGTTNGTPYFTVLNSHSAQMGVDGSAFNFSKGTTNTATLSIAYNVTVRHNGADSVYRITLTYTVSYDATNDTIELTVTNSTSPSTPAIFTRKTTRPTISVSVYGSKSVLGDPTIIDCENGEVYKEVADGIVSLNPYIDLGAELPKLAVGNDTVTTSGSITECKITPRWWKI